MAIRKLIAAVAFAAMAFVAPESQACSLVAYRGDSTLVIVGRSLDWKTPIPTNLYVYLNIHWVSLVHFHIIYYCMRSHLQYLCRNQTNES